MLSRVAQSVYWIGRYIERAENIARFAEVNQYLTLDLPPGAGEQWEPLIDITGDRAEFFDRYGEATRENVLRFLTFDTRYANSIASCIRRARENARSVRDVITLELWEQIHRFHEMITAAAERFSGGMIPYEFYSQVRNASHLLHGLADDTMSHGETWHFLRLGRMLERADKTARLLDVKYFILLPSVDEVGMPWDDLLWCAVLKSASALEMYRKRFGRVRPDRIIEFLILDRTFPRSALYCIDRAQGHLHAISGTPAGAFRTPPEQQLGRLHARLTYARPEDLVLAGLHEVLDELLADLNAISRGIHDTYFSPGPATIRTEAILVYNPQQQQQ
ncbi:MAG: alpha-E domain-containing protein [Kiritimatiellae bacterium]|nr:alpha-E domain-containing protein [Kiritimatiellia bacterium]MDW8459242.1 alpha-E domain-containing protein [Verrucomicrobiota bacterium]